VVCSISHVKDGRAVGRKRLRNAGLVITVILSGNKVLGFKPGRARWIFKDDKNL
jgi:hypothetical protein